MFNVRTWSPQKVIKNSDFPQRCKKLRQDISLLHLDSDNAVFSLSVTTHALSCVFLYLLFFKRIRISVVWIFLIVYFHLLTNSLYVTYTHIILIIYTLHIFYYYFFHSTILFCNIKVLFFLRIWNYYFFLLCVQELYVLCVHTLFFRNAVAPLLALCY